MRCNVRSSRFLWVWPTLLFLAALFLRQPLETSMALHMLVHIPLLAVTGVLMGLWLHHVFRPAGTPGARMQQVRSTWGRWNLEGVPGMLFGSATGMFWMVPKALDDVLLFPEMEIVKFVSVLFAGVLFYDGWQRSHNVVRMFFVGGFCWTSAVAGMLYQESTTRLCNFYLLDDQVIAGRGLVALAIALPVWWGVVEWRRYRQTI